MINAQTRISSSITRTTLGLALIVITTTIAFGWLAIVKTEGKSATVTTANLRNAQTADLTKTLTRSGYSSEGTSVDVILTTPTFFKLTNRPREAASLNADRNIVFVANESVHYGDLPHHLAPILRVDNNLTLVPTETRVLADAVHHRTTVLIFGNLSAEFLNDRHKLELLLPQTQGGTRTSLEWYTPVEYPDSVQASGLSLGLLLSLAAGLLAAISPCLLQLTAFYLPTLAGVSADANTKEEQGRVVTAALLFVLGFTIPYTAGGALMGGMGQALAASGWLTPTGPIAAGAGWVMVVMAGVIAYRARAPLVCKLPMPNLIHSRRLPFVEPFVSGFAIATGCLACFGGAILAVLLVYTGLLGSAFLGGLAMFFFSMGIAIPFLAAAFSLSWVAPLATRLQRMTPVVGLVSSVLMLFFGLSMATGNFHIVSGWLFQHLPLN